jgi:hypothetical protein|tara:strand:- start:3580 stop:4062 length:483 start_codon:yes stop_codon:yes gene_type:complete
MIQENNLILGFKSLKELATYIFGIKSSFVNFCTSTLAITTSFITSYVWDDASAVYFMLFLIIADAATGVWKSIKYKTFRSSKLPRILVLSILYVLMLSISWNASRFSPLFIWLPGLVYGGLIGTQIVSIYENISELGYLPKGLLYDIKDRIINKIRNNKN